MRFHVDRRLIKPYLTGFYKKDSFAKYLKNIVPLSMFIGVGGGVLSFLISFLYQFFSYDPIKEAIHHVGGFLKLSGLAFVIAFCVVTGAVILFKFINYCLITKKMEKLEKSLEPIMISLPAFYRSYNKMLLISQTYFAVKGVLPEQAFKACDENLDVLDPRPVPGIMFDLPFKNNLITDTTYTAKQVLPADKTVNCHDIICSIRENGFRCYLEIHKRIVIAQEEIWRFQSFGTMFSDYGSMPNCCRKA